MFPHGGAGHASTSITFSASTKTVMREPSYVATTWYQTPRWITSGRANEMSVKSPRPSAGLLLRAETLQ
eukprot:3441538-Rhodomonas_salina.1